MRMIRNLVSALLVGASIAIGAVTNAVAAVPAGVETLFTTTATDFATVLGYGYVLFLAVVGGLIIIKLVKKVFFKST